MSERKYTPCHEHPGSVADCSLCIIHVALGDFPARVGNRYIALSPGAKLSGKGFADMFAAIPVSKNNL
jgi:hypothetical protein